ncbi:hypothetical protein CerSpe_021100 [Prunus speciosa]
MKLITLPFPLSCSSNPTLLRFKFKPQSSLNPTLDFPKSQSPQNPTKFPVIIIGGGLAGLAAATYLNSQNTPFLLLEASDAVGGRVRTNVVEGFLLDHDFQIFITAYSEAQNLLDYNALNLCKFYSENSITNRKEASDGDDGNMSGLCDGFAREKGERE